MKTLRLVVALVVVFCALGERAEGQSIFTNPITGTNPNTSNPYTTGQTVNSRLTVLGIGRGAGVTGANANDRYNASAWNVTSLSSAVSESRYFTWSITPDANYIINFADIVINTQVSGTGPGNWSFQSTVGGFGSSNSIATGGTGLAGGAGSVGTISNGTLGSAFDAVTQSTEFRLYGYNGSSSAGTFSVNDFTFNGTVSLRSAGTLVWDGGQANGDWNAYTGTAMNQSNWNANNIPVASRADSLRFTGGTQTTTNNNIVGLTLDTISFDSLASSFTLNGSALTLNSGVTNSSGVTQTINLQIALGSNQTWDTGSGGIVASGVISGSGSLTKVGAGTLALGGVNTYTGNTQINEGILAVSDTSNLGSAGNSVIFNGGTLKFAAGSTFDLSTRTVTINGGGATIHTDGGNVTFVNAIGNNGTGGLTKAAAGTLTLNGANTYTGATTITGGTLALGSSGSINNSSGVTVGINTFFDVSAVTGYTLGSSTAQTLQGSGTVVGGVTVASGSTIRGGDAATVGTLTLTDGLTLNSGARIGINIDAAGNSAAAGTGGSSSESNNSVLSITGGATISSGTVFTIDGTGVAFTLNQPYSYLIVTGAGDQSGLNITNPSQFDAIGFSAEMFSVTGTSGGDVFLNFTPVPVPEPATVLGIAVAALGVGGFVRRRFRKPSAPTSAA